MRLSSPDEPSPHPGGGSSRTLDHMLEAIITILTLLALTYLGLSLIYVLIPKGKDRP